MAKKKAQNPLETLKAKLAEIGIDDDAIGKLEAAKMLREAALRRATYEMLTGDAGLAPGDALAIKDEFPSEAAPAASTGGITDEGLLAALAKLGQDNATAQKIAFEQLATTLSDTEKLKDKDVCMNITGDNGETCGYLLPKGYEGNCPGCGMLVAQEVAECGLCGTHVPAEMKNAQFCPGCALPLYDGKQLDAAKFLLDSGTGQVQVPQMIEGATVPMLGDWAKRGKKIKGLVINPKNKVESAADAARSFRQPEFQETAGRSGRFLQVNARW